jgi:hypothetical protein
MPKYNYGKTFKKNGKLMRYRYTNKRKSTKKLVTAYKIVKKTKPFRNRSSRYSGYPRSRRY